LTSEKAAELLREKTSEFRRASAFVDHQAKCVKTFLKVITEMPEKKNAKLISLLGEDIDSPAVLKKWSAMLAGYWNESTNIDPKNRSMYQKYWSDFIAVLHSSQDNDYADHVAFKINSYLDDSNQELFKKNYRRIKDSVRKADEINFAPKSSLKLDSGRASLATTFSMPGEKVQQMKEDLLFMFASDPLLQSQQLEISVNPDDAQTLVVKFSPPKEMLTYRRVIQALNSNIETAYSQISK
jgi:hypothetical protein